MPNSSAREHARELLDEVQRRRRWNAEQKLALVMRAAEPGMSVSLVAREASITASQLFKWRKAFMDGELSAAGADEPVLRASELHDAQKRIRQLEAALGRKVLENELLKEALALAKSRK